MSDHQTFVIVGAGLAGAKAAETLREEGFDGRVVLIGDEPELPYERPPLSKKYLAGEAAREDAHVHPHEFYEERDIELLSGALATGLDVDGHRVSLADSRSVEYDRLLIATGAVPRRPPIDGARLGGVFVLRTLADADALRARFSGTSSGSTIVTSPPRVRAAAATSQPIHPAPTITTRGDPARAATSASASATSRRYRTPGRSAPATGSRRGVAPVASSRRE